VVVAVTDVKAEPGIDSQPVGRQLVDGAVGLPQPGRAGEDLGVEETGEWRLVQELRDLRGAVRDETGSDAAGAKPVQSGGGIVARGEKDWRCMSIRSLSASSIASLPRVTPSETQTRSTLERRSDTSRCS
jgi:hypothetical protein